ncbi:hypothetical protein FQN60_012119 [Etheostoma spectabile]|uniref:t-SNARE coiled-coil homology domain-containing protein n=1 Tax=Etheostoma spectabile TaxID=54343 RepID=A0A5J5DND3_9PERO|nr:hypothetical protein FQN60_012119 [Etheostoma spectabile]
MGAGAGTSGGVVANPWLINESEETSGLTFGEIKQQQQRVIEVSLFLLSTLACYSYNNRSMAEWAQDAGLDALAAVISRQKIMGKEIGNELEEQNGFFFSSSNQRLLLFAHQLEEVGNYTTAVEIIDDLAHLVDKTDDRIRNETRRVKLVETKSASCGMLVVIVLLLIAIIVVATLAGHVFGADPQELVPTADAALALLVDRDDVDGKLPPLTGFVCLQDVHLDSCKIAKRLRRQQYIPSSTLLAPAIQKARGGHHRSSAVNLLHISLLHRRLCHDPWEWRLTPSVTYQHNVLPAAPTGWQSHAVRKQRKKERHIVAVASSRVVATVEADSSTLPSRQLVQLHVETTPSGMKLSANVSLPTAITSTAKNKTPYPTACEQGTSSRAAGVLNKVCISYCLYSHSTLTDQGERRGVHWEQATPVQLPISSIYTSFITILFLSSSETLGDRGIISHWLVLMLHLNFHLQPTTCPARENATKTRVGSSKGGQKQDTHLDIYRDLVRHGVEVRVTGQLRVVLVFVAESVQPAEDDFYVSGCYPVLQHRGVVKVVRRRSAVQRAEGDEPAGQRVHVGVGVRAHGLLLVLLRDNGPVWLIVHLPALGRVKLKGYPSFTVVHGLVNNHGFGSRREKLQAHISDLKLLTEGQSQGDILRVLDEVLGLPASEVVRVVQVRQVRWWVVLFGVRGIAGVAVPGPLIPFLRRCHHAVAIGRLAAGAGYLYFLAEGGVDEVRDATPWVAVLVVAGVRGRSLSREQTHPVAAERAPARQGRGEQHSKHNIHSPYHGRSLGPQVSLQLEEKGKAASVTEERGRERERERES